MNEMTNNQQENEINIHWEGPFSHEEIQKFNQDTDFGLYAIYGTHPLYGTDKLIYIGKTEKQTFASRLTERSVIINDSDPKNVKIYLGRIYFDNTYFSLSKDDGINKTQMLINNAEKLLINF